MAMATDKCGSKECISLALLSHGPISNKYGGKVSSQDTEGEGLGKLWYLVVYE